MALLGRNGAGKSTTLKAIVGIAPPARGCVRVHRRRCRAGNRTSSPARGIGFVPEDRQVVPRAFCGRQPADRCEEGPGRSGLLEPEAHLRDVPTAGAPQARMGGLCRAASNRCSPSPAR